MAQIVITDFAFTVVPPGNQTCTIEYRLTSDPDVPASYILVSNNVPVLPNGHLPNPVLITGLDAETSYTVKATNNCGGVGVKVIFITPNPTCPPGYTLSPDHTFCYQQTSVPADYIGGGSAYVICRNQFSSYSPLGARIMKPSGYDNQGVPLAGAGNTPTSVTTNAWWRNFAPNTTDGPLNRSGIWPCAAGNVPCNINCPPVNTDVGFSRQFIVPTSKVYYIGIGCDNFAKVELQDGVSGLHTIFTQNPLNIGNYFMETGDPEQIVFAAWLIYPVFLNAGPNILTITAQNTSTGPAVIGFEIYDNTEAEIVAATGYSDLTYIFSTDVGLMPTPFIHLLEDFQAGNYSCAAHPGSSLTYDAGTNTYSCTTINTVPPNT